MRNRICLAAAVLCALAGEPAAAQGRTGSVLDRKVTVTFSQAPLESVLRTLRRQYGVRISYSNTALNLRQPVTLNVQNQPLRAVLGEVLAGKNIGYELVGDQLVLHPAPAPATTTTVSRTAPDKAPEAPATPAVRPATAAPEAPAAGKPAAPAAPAARPQSRPAARKTPGKPSSSTAPTGKASPTGRAQGRTAGSKGVGAASAPAPRSKTTEPAEAGRAAAAPDGPTAPESEAAAAPTGAPGQAATPTAAVATTGPTTPPAPAEAAAGPDARGAIAADSAAAAPAEQPEPARPTFTRKAQVSLLGPLGSNGLRSGQTVNHVSVNVLGGYSAGVAGFEAGGLFNVVRDTVTGVQVAGLANLVGHQLNGFQAAGLLNVVGGSSQGWQAAGLLNVATRPVVGAQTAGLFNYAGPHRRVVGASAALTASTAGGGLVTEAADAAPKPAVQAAGLFNVALGELRGGQVAGLLNVGGTVRGVQLAGLLNVADSVQGVSIAPFNFVRHGYHRLDVTYSEAWPLTATLKLGGSPAFYTFFAGAYDGFGSSPRRWALGYGAGTDVWARRRVSLSLDAVAMHVNEEQRGFTRALNLHNQLRLLVGVAPFKAGSHLRIIGGPTVSVLVTQRYDSTEGKVQSALSQGRRHWLDEGNAITRVLGWYGYSVGLRF